MAGADGARLRRPTSSLRAAGLPLAALPKAAGRGRDTQGCREAGQGWQPPGCEQKPRRSLLGAEAACAAACPLPLPEPAQPFLSQGCTVSYKRRPAERGRLERRAESFLKGNAVVVFRRSFHICGWRFPGFSEVNAGSAGCRQIRFTSDLSNRLAAHWLSLLLSANAAACRPALKLGGSSHTCRDPAAPCHKSLPFEAATES